MSATQAVDPTASLKELQRRFEDAAFDHSEVEAVVVYRPDLRRSEAELHAVENLTQPYHDPYCTIEALTSRWLSELPPDGEREPSGTADGAARAVVPVGLCATESASLVDGHWQLLLIAHTWCDSERALLEALAGDAAALALQGKGLDISPLADWLIFLADRDERLHPAARRYCVKWSNHQPTWVLASATRNAGGWWAVRLPNLFALSKVAVGQAIEAAGHSETGRAGVTGEFINPPEHMLPYTSGTILQCGPVWKVEFGLERAEYIVKDLSALRVLATLLTRPHRSFRYHELVPVDPRALAEGIQSQGDLIDQKGIDQLREKLKEIRAEMERNVDNHLIMRELESDQAHILKQLTHAAAPRGRRKLGMNAAPVKAWGALRKKMWRLRLRLKDEMPEFADHLERSVQFDCPTLTYHPPEMVSWHIDLMPI
jgi:hypothetical protein